MTADTQTINERLEALEGADVPWQAKRPRIEEFLSLVESFEPLPPGERARILLYCILKYAPDAFSHGELFSLIEQAKKKP
jgi:hypothetical protein